MRIRKCLQRHQSRKGGKNNDVVQSHSVISKGPFYEDIDLDNKASNIETNKKCGLWNCHKASSLFIIIFIWHCILFYVMTKYNFCSVLLHENAKLHQLNRNDDNYSLLW